MPSCKITCHLCNEEVSENILGTHLLSKKHREKLLSGPNVRSLTTHLERLDSGKSMDRKREPPTFRIKEVAYQICLTCKKCYTCSEHASGALKHYATYPKCGENATEALRSLLNPSKEKKSTVGDEEMRKALREKDDEIEALKKKLVKMEKELDFQKESYEDRDQEAEKYFTLLKGLTGEEQFEDVQGFLNETDDYVPLNQQFLWNDYMDRLFQK